MSTYLVKARRKFNQFEYFAGYHEETVVISMERKNAKHCTEEEANRIVDLLSGPYTKYEKEKIS